MGVALGWRALWFRHYVFSWRHRIFLSVTWHPIRSQERGAVWRTRKCSNRWAELSTAPASTPAKFEEVHRVKHEFLRPGISSTLTTVSFDIVGLLLSCCCYPGTGKSSGLCYYIVERRFVAHGLNCSSPTLHVAAFLLACFKVKLKNAIIILSALSVPQNCREIAFDLKEERPAF